MTRGAGSGRRPVTPRDPYGLLPSGSALGPLLALVGLAVVGLLTLSLLSGQLPFVTSGGDGGGGDGGAGPATTPAPSNVVVVPKDPRADVPGSIVYAKQGSIWIQSGTTVRQLTTGGSDSMPAWTSDGQWIYFIRTKSERALWPNDNGQPRYYTITYPLIMRVHPDGGEPEQVASGKYKKGSRTWFYWIRQPTPNPADPSQLALLSDEPDPTKSNVVLQLYDIEAKKYTRPKGTKETPPLGHQDPAWHPRGSVLLYVRNDRDGRKGAPSIWRYDPAKDRSAQVTGPGYLAPSLLARRQVHRRHQDDAVRHRHRHPRRGLGRRGAAGDRRRRLLVARLVAAGRLDRVPPHQRPHRRPADGDPPGQRPRCRRQGHHRPDRGLRPRRLLTAVVVHPGLPAAAPVALAVALAGGVRLALAEPSMSGYLARLAARSAAVGSVLCVGLDPDPEALPAGFSRDVAGVERFCALTLEAAVPFAAAVKPNLAFFEAFGAAGMAALERLRATLPADLPLIADAKRGDIGSTAARQAVALFDGLGADAVTVSPYLGEEAIAPLLEREDRFAYVLCRTSNPGAGELQDLVVEADAAIDAPAEPLHRRVARRVGGWGPGATVGLVVGATAPAELEAIRVDRSRPGLPGARRRRPGRRDRAGARARQSQDRAGRRSAGWRSAGERLARCRRGGDRPVRTRALQSDPFERVAEAARDWAARLPVLS